jgi:RHS repeat-associated protein
MLITFSTNKGTYTYAGTGYANPHAPTQIGSTTYSYDTNGNLISAGTKYYAWNYRNEMIRSSVGSTASTTYSYDHLGSRLTKKSGTSATSTYPMPMFTLNGTATTSYVSAQGELMGTLDVPGTSTQTRIHRDHLSSTNAVTNASGTVVSTITYHPYGDEMATTGVQTVDRRYIGERLDQGEELSYLNARYFDSKQGQFLSQDPMFWSLNQNLYDPQTFNSYSYASNNPINKKDPTGLLTKTEKQILQLQIKVIELQLKLITLQNKALDKGITAASAFNDPVQGLKDVGNTNNSMTTRVTSGIGVVGSIAGGGGAPRQAVSASVRVSSYTIGRAGESRLVSLLGTKAKEQTPYFTSLGKRYVDAVVDGAIHEAKNGYSYATSRNLTQAAKDAEIMATKGVEATWHLFKGGSDQLKNTLTDWGIKVIDYTE